MRDQLRIGSWLTWIVAWLCVLAALGMALLFDGADWTWWIGMLLLIPIVALSVWRQDQRGESDPYHSAGDGGPWGPPA